jgi:hypothetical protein
MKLIVAFFLMIILQSAFADSVITAVHQTHLREKSVSESLKRGISHECEVVRKGEVLSKISCVKSASIVVCHGLCSEGFNSFINKSGKKIK